MKKYVGRLCFCLLSGFVFFSSDAEAAASPSGGDDLAGYGVVQADVMSYQQHLWNPDGEAFQSIDAISTTLMDFRGKGARTTLVPEMRITEAQKRVAATTAVAVGFDLTARLKGGGKQRTLMTVVRTLLNGLDIGNSLRKEAKKFSVQAVHDIHILVLTSLASAFLLDIENKDVLSTLSEAFSLQRDISTEHRKGITVLLPRIVRGNYAILVNDELKRNESTWAGLSIIAMKRYARLDQVFIDSSSHFRPLHLYIEEKKIDAEENKVMANQVVQKMNRQDTLTAMELKVEYYQSLGFHCATMLQLQDLIAFISKGQFVLEKKDLSRFAKLIDVKDHAVNSIVFIENTYLNRSNNDEDKKNNQAWVLMRYLMPFEIETGLVESKEAFEKTHRARTQRAEDLIVAHHHWYEWEIAWIQSRRNVINFRYYLIQYFLRRGMRERDFHSGVSKAVLRAHMILPTNDADVVEQAKYDDFFKRLPEINQYTYGLDGNKLFCVQKR